MAEESVEYPEGPVKPSVADGRTYGYWKVLGIAAKKSPAGEVYWWCSCRCGTEKAVSRRELQRGKSKSCGCKRRKEQDMLGKRFGQLVVLSRAKRAGATKKQAKNAYWKCRCDCGREGIYLGPSLRNGGRTSCGCARIKDITGQRFGKLVAVRWKDIHSGQSRWVCECDCGKLVVRTGSQLTKGSKEGRFSHCGCARVIHGRAGTPEYYMWLSARERAKKQGVPFSIEIDHIKIPPKCPALGIELRVNKGGGSFSDNSPTLDKIIPEKGYVPGNIVVMSWRANRLKCDGTPEELLSVASFVSSTQSSGWDPRFLRGSLAQKALSMVA